jgi:predicted CoA-substrate-specific enzyme activase
MRVIGLDIGSRTVKRVVTENSEILDWVVVPNSHEPLAVCDELLAGINGDRVIATGYGRRLFAGHRDADTVTEIRAAAVGARAVLPATRTLLDIGGQDTKVVALGDDGSVAKFEMNDRCAAGTGRFLEVMATALGYSMDEFVDAGRGSPVSTPINAMCTVFAESEVISATARGADRAALARGLNEAVAQRAVAMLRRIRIEDEVVFVGGGALNTCLHELVATAIGRDVHVPPEAQILTAYGAALSAENRRRGLDGS